MIFAIAAVDENLAIGYRGQLIARIAPDLKRFREITRGCTLIYGRKTLETFPNGKPLPKRENIVLTRGGDIQGVHTAHSIDEALMIARSFGRNIAIIGGESVYAQFMQFCECVYITRIHKTFPADAFFPKLSDDWRLNEQSEDFEYEGLRFCYCVFRRTTEQPLK